MSDEEIELAMKRFSDGYSNDVRMAIAAAKVDNASVFDDTDTIPF